MKMSNSTNSSSRVSHHSQVFSMSPRPRMCSSEVVVGVAYPSSQTFDLQGAAESVVIKPYLSHTPESPHRGPITPDSKIIIIIAATPASQYSNTPDVRLYYYRHSLPNSQTTWRVGCVRRTVVHSLMRLPTRARLGSTCSGSFSVLCNTPKTSLSHNPSSPLLSSTTETRNPSVGQSRVLLTAALNPRLANKTASRLRSPLQWSRIAHGARDPTYLPGLGSIGKMEGSQQVRAHSHGHGGHHHHHDTTFLTSANKSDPGVKITRVGLYVNLGMAVAKGAGGYIFNSQA